MCEGVHMLNASRSGHSAVHFVTMVVGFCLGCASSDVPGSSVLDILCEKHPEPGVNDESASCRVMSFLPLLDLDITADYVERVLQVLVEPPYCSDMATSFSMVFPAGSSCYVALSPGK